MLNSAWYVIILRPRVFGCGFNPLMHGNIKRSCCVNFPLCLCLHPNPGGIPGVHRDGHPLHGSRRHKTLDDSASQRPSVPNERGQHVLRGLWEIILPVLFFSNLYSWLYVVWLFILFFLYINISSFCQCTDAVASICTLYELGKSLASLKEKKHYEELNLGPLCKLPIIHRMFKIDSNTRDDDIHQIETVDILKVSLASCSSWQEHWIFIMLSFMYAIFQYFFILMRSFKQSLFKTLISLKILDDENSSVAWLCSHLHITH